MWLIFFSSLIIVSSLVIFFSGSPYFALFGVLLQALAFSMFLCFYGFPFFGLLIVLIYVGGMLIVFLFSTILCAERFPEIKGFELFIFWFGLSFLFCPLIGSWEPSLLGFSYTAISSELELGEIFGLLGIFTFLVALVLLLALIVVLSLGFEHTKLSLRKL
uniref:NADH-ubiquinone oxidoreductase chain 6 n=1 Tax=Ophiarachnella gorgonia TaxID=1365872 RepID=A0A6C0FCS6_9ECHI|nr:NADH dehydrogenase subunit 6 [Ophiarachnella gorgonia]QHT54256.1 NADH dehydrogenase subunit 6 [Ophiarachnella gorgonia]